MEAARIRYVACPLCEGADTFDWRTANCAGHPLYHHSLPATMTWLRCGGCGHVFTDGYFNDEAMALVLAKMNADQRAGHEMEATRPYAARIIAKVAESCPPMARRDEPAAWLDVGFGNGALIFTADEWGYIPTGLDLRPGNVEAMREAGFSCLCCDIADFAPRARVRYDVISMADVLEHMPFPKRALAAARRLLVPGGVLFLSMPNADCALWDWLTAQNANPYWGEIEHFHNFGRKRLYALLAECGFVQMTYGISERYRCGMEIIAR